MMHPSLLRRLLVVVCLLLGASGARSAAAYPWMIRHGYTGCTTCHTDPSGGGVLTAYGRAQGEILLRTRWGDDSEEPGRVANFLWGAVELPESVRLGGDVREAGLLTKVKGSPMIDRLLLMRADLMGDVHLGRFRAAASIGYAPKGALYAALTRSAEDNLVSREHWLGVELDEDGAWLLRAGRIALPYGIRNIEHTLSTRAATRTNTDDQQQHGIALSLSTERVRGELMAVLGNYMLRPDDYRERGYSAYAELAVLPNLAVGVSSLFTRASRDILYRVTDYRQAHGLFLRYSPAEVLVLLAEANLLHQSLTWNGHRTGHAAALQADLEPTQGVHFMLTAESRNDDEGVPGLVGGWASAVWFFAPHADVRLDEIYQRVGIPGGTVDAFSLLLQGHVYL